MTNPPFRPRGGPNSDSRVLAELARLWDQAAHKMAGKGEQLTQKKLAAKSRVPLTTVNTWATGSSLPRDLDALDMVGATLAEWADDNPPNLRQWERLLRTDQSARDISGADSRDGVLAGWPLAQVGDPFALEVHQPVQPADPRPGLPVLPAYVPREHDEMLGTIVRRAAGGRSGIAVLVGGSSTGKTRACWEALQLLRDRPEKWRLWHPIDPSRPGAALRELPGIGRRTVVWLNEAQFYLDVPEGGLGEQVAAGLRELLRDPDRAPVLVLATLWPQFWDSLTDRPAGRNDPHDQARELLVGHDITVPATFSAGQLRELRQSEDPRLAQAAKAAQDGQVIQFLAGAPVLLAQYRNAPPAATALISAAMDARRLGMGIALPQAFLQAAAPGYLTDAEWDALDDDNWLEQALAYTAKQAKGARGPLTRIRRRSARARFQDSDQKLACVIGGPVHRLADYLDQHGRQHRANQIPPADFWVAAASYADPSDLRTLAEEALDRGLYRDAAQLYKNAAAHGDIHGVHSLLKDLYTLHFTDLRPLAWAAAHASTDDPAAVAGLLDALREAGAANQVATLADRAATGAPLNPYAVAKLLKALREAGAANQVATLADRAATGAPLNPYAVAELLKALREAGAADQVATLADRAATGAPLDDPAVVAWLLKALREAGAANQVATLADRAATGAPLDDPRAVAELLKALREAGAANQVATLLARDPAAHAPLDDPAVVAWLGALRQAGATSQISTLARRAVDHASLDDPRVVARLLDALRWAGATSQVSTLLDRDPAAHARFDNPGKVAELLKALREAGAANQVTTLADRAATGAPLDDPGAVAELLKALREAGAANQVTTLLARDPAAHVAVDLLDFDRFLRAELHAAADQLEPVPRGLRRISRAIRGTPLGAAVRPGTPLGAAVRPGTPLGAAVRAGNPRGIAAPVRAGNPRGVAGLLDTLREAGAANQVATLADRAATGAPLDDPRAVAELLKALREAGAANQVATLADRAATGAPLNPYAVAELLKALREAGAANQVATLLARDPAAHAPLNPYAVPGLLEALREAGAADQVATLADRAATGAPLDDPRAVAELLKALREAGAADQVATLLARDPAAHAPLDRVYAVAELLDALREAGAQEHAKVLIDKLPGAALFELFREQEGHKERFRFGREADGSPAEPWDWKDLS